MYQRGDIVAVDFPFTDGSASKKRPAIIISNNSIAPTGDVIVLMVTSKSSDVAPILELTPELLTRALPKSSFVKCHRVYTIDSRLLNGKYSNLTKRGLELLMEKFLSVVA